MSPPKMTKGKRFSIFLERLGAAPPSNSREGALALMKLIMNNVEDEFSGTDRKNYSERMHVWDWEYQWTNLDSDPCFWDDSVAKTHRTKIYHSGRIEITNLKAVPPLVVLDKSGAV